MNSPDAQVFQQILEEILEQRFTTGVVSPDDDETLEELTQSLKKYDPNATIDEKTKQVTFHYDGSIEDEDFLDLLRWYDFAYSFQYEITQVVNPLNVAFEEMGSDIRLLLFYNSWDEDHETKLQLVRIKPIGNMHVSR